MMRLPVFVFSLLISSLVLAQQVASETPAAHVFTAWLDAVDSGDPVRYKDFDDKYQPPRPMAQVTEFRKQTGGFVLMP